MKLTQTKLNQMILQELNIALGIQLDEIQITPSSVATEPAPDEPADFGSTTKISAIEEDEEWEDEDAFNAPELKATAIQGRGRGIGLDIEEVQYWIDQVQEMPEGDEKRDMLDLIRQQLFR